MSLLLSDVATAIGALATAIGVGFGVRRLRMLEKQAVTRIQDSLSIEYRRVVAGLPVSALLGDELAASEPDGNLAAMYRYVDLCNQQAYLKSVHRISDDTWRLWEDGIRTNLRRPAFARAWTYIAAHATGDFDELRRIVPPDSGPAHATGRMTR